MTTVININGTNDIIKNAKDLGTFLAELEKRTQQLDGKDYTDDSMLCKVTNYLEVLKQFVQNRFSEQYENIISKVLSLPEIAAQLSVTRGEFKDFNKYVLYQMVGTLRACGFYNPDISDSDLDRSLENTDHTSRYRQYMGKIMEQPIKTEIENILKQS